MSLLQLENVDKTYGRSKPVLSAFSATLSEGLTLLTGPSGAGKTTLLRLISTAERPSRGTIRWNAEPLPKARLAMRRVLGYAPQAVDLPEDLTAREFGVHMAALKGLSAASADAQFRLITDRIGLLPDINRRIAAFSGGMRRRLILAQALLGTPRLIVLDEPTAELDKETAGLVEELILEHAESAVVVMTTHSPENLAGSAQATLWIDAGKAVAV